MRYKEIDINIKAIPDKEDEALLNQLMGAKGVSVTDDGDKSEQPATIQERLHQMIQPQWHQFIHYNKN